MNVYKWTVTIDGDEGAMFDSFNEANDYARNNQGVLTEYEFEYSDSYVVTDYTGQQQDDEVEGMIGLVGEDAS